MRLSLVLLLVILEFCRSLDQKEVVCALSQALVVVPNWDPAHANHLCTRHNLNSVDQFQGGQFCTVTLKLKMLFVILLELYVTMMGSSPACMGIFPPCRVCSQFRDLCNQFIEGSLPSEIGFLPRLQEL